MRSSSWEGIGIQHFLLQKATQRSLTLTSFAEGETEARTSVILELGQDVSHHPSFLCYLQEISGHTDLSILERLCSALRQGEQSIQRYLTLAPPNTCTSFPVGKPIPVQKKYKPSDEEVDQIHQKYLKELSELFEKHKAKYNVPEDCHLEFV